MTTPTHPRIAIIGGGPAGLTLFITLHRRGIPATVYERELSFNTRAHLGGMLDLGYSSGQRALRENGLGDAFALHSRPEADAYRLCNAAGTIISSKDPEAGADPRDVRPEIDRSVLRKVMVDAMPPDSIKWGHALAAVRELGDGSGARELTFANGHTTVVDILVGADGGLASRVRPLVSPALPIYHGVTAVEFVVQPEVARTPELADTVRFIGPGSVFAIGKAQMLLAQVHGDGRIRMYALFPVPADWRLPADGGEARGLLLEKFAGWAPTFRQLIEHCDGDQIYLRPMYHLPVGHRWAHVPGVTILGDAAHLMSPFAAAGVNLAMLDAFELGLALADNINNGRTVEEREAAVAKWEEERMAAAEKVAGIAKANLEATFGPDSPASGIAAMRIHLEEPDLRRRA